MPALAIALVLAAAPDLGPLARLIGVWQGTAQGEPGRGTVRREYRLALEGRFIEVKNTSTYEREVHHDRGFISFDQARGLFVYRQFHGEGFVNTYAGAPDPGRVVMTSEAIENIAPGWRARETWTFPSADEFVEVFELAPPGKDFAVYTRSHLRRVTAASPGAAAKGH